MAARDWKFRIEDINAAVKEVLDLTQDMDLTFIVYDMFAHKVYEKQLVAGIDEGAKKGWNTIPFNRSILSGFDLPSAVYFFIFIYEGKVIGKGKMAIVP